MGGLIRMTFSAEVSGSAGGAAVVSGVVSSPTTVPGTLVGSDSSGFAGGAGFGGAGGVSREARIREIGGKTARFGLTWPSSAFLLGFFRSMSETLSASRFEGRAVSGAGFDPGEVRGFVAGAASSFNFCFGSFVLAAAAAGLRAAVVSRGAGLRVAVLLLVFVAIVVRLKFCSWPELP